jgi:hypothetical protein
MKKIALIIIALGDPYREFKLKILTTNVAKVRAIPDAEVVIHVNQYTNDPTLTAAILAIDPKIVINLSPGYLFQLVHQFNKPEQYADFDHIIMTLDDVEITNMDFPVLFKEQTDLKLDIISPKVIGGHQAHMRSENSTDVCLATFIEFFFYIFTPAVYHKYFYSINPDSSTMWGYDLLLFYLNNFKCAIDYRYTVTHHLRATSNTDNGYAEVNALIKDLDINIWFFANPLMPLVPSDDSHVIKSAYYGSKDVTEFVRRMYDGGSRIFPATNVIYGDTNPGYYKFLVINHQTYGILFAIEEKACKLAHHNNAIILGA